MGSTVLGSAISERQVRKSPMKKKLFERDEAQREPWSLLGHIKCAIPIRQSSGDVRWMGVRPEVQEAQMSLVKSPVPVSLMSHFPSGC